MGGKAPFSVRFWGVRGSIACSGPRTARYGGNTSSLEVRCGERMLLFDAGTGIRYLGRALDDARLDADLYFTHTHFDHVCGLPFFRPLFHPQNRFRLWAGHLSGAMTLKRVLAEFMMSPLFPVPPDVFKSTLEYRDFNAGETLDAGPGISLRTATLNHPDGASVWVRNTPTGLPDCTSSVSSGLSLRSVSRIASKQDQLRAALPMPPYTTSASGFSATSASRLFWIMRYAASICQLAQASWLPRGARTGRGPLPANGLEDAMVNSRDAARI